MEVMITKLDDTNELYNVDTCEVKSLTQNLIVVDMQKASHNCRVIGKAIKML